MKFSMTASPDLDGRPSEFLKRHSYRRFILIGHSLGAIKSIIYQGIRQLPEIIGIVSCSAPRQFYSERAARQPGFKEVIERAEALIAAGKGDELLSVAVGSAPGIFTARSHVNKYGRDDNNDCRPYAKRLGCPLLAIVGSAEPKFFYEYAQEIVAAAGPSSSCKLVDGANHFYNRHTAEIVEVMDQWLGHVCRLVNCNSYITFAVHGSRASPRTACALTVHPELVEGFFKLGVNLPIVTMRYAMGCFSQRCS